MPANAAALLRGFAVAHRYHRGCGTNDSPDEPVAGSPMRTDKVWMTGEKFDVAYLLDLDDKNVRRYVQRGVDVGPTAGFMEKITGRRRVGWYVSPADWKLHVRLGHQDFGVQQVGRRLAFARTMQPLDTTRPHHRPGRNRGAPTICPRSCGPSASRSRLRSF